MSERFNPRIHSLDYASKRLDELAQESRAEQRVSEQDTSGYLIREEIGFLPEGVKRNTYASDMPIRIDFSPDLDKEAMGKCISEAMEKAVNQICNTPREQSAFHVDPVFDEEEDEDDPFASVENMRAFVQSVVRKVLEEDAREISENKAFQPVSTHRHRRVRQFDETGKEWRGVLYPVDKDSDL